jgi:hypothetical protein
MSGEDSYSAFIPRDDYLRKDLYGDNIAGFLHNDATQMVKGFHQANQPASFVTGVTKGSAANARQIATQTRVDADQASIGPRPRTAMAPEPSTRNGKRG